MRNMRGRGVFPTVELFEWAKTLSSLENFRRQGKNETRKWSKYTISTLLSNSAKLFRESVAWPPCSTNDHWFSHVFPKIFVSSPVKLLPQEGLQRRVRYKPKVFICMDPNFWGQICEVSNTTPSTSWWGWRVLGGLRKYRTTRREGGTDGWIS